MRVFSNPQKIIEEFGLELGMKVADLGSGSGFYSMEAARAVGSQGKVYAVDVQQDLLSKLKENASSEGLECIEIVWGDAEKIGGTRLKESFVDRVLATNILFQVDDKDALATEVWRILKPGGKLLVVDWTDSFGGLGPQSSQVFPADEAKKLFSGKNFSHLKDISAGEHHYGVIFKKPGV